MDIKDYIKQSGISRKAFAKQLKIELSYLHNICQHPEKAGKKTISKIIAASNGAVTFDDMTQGRGADRPDNG